MEEYYSICVKKVKKDNKSGELKLITLENNDRIAIDLFDNFYYNPYMDSIIVESNYKSLIDDIYEENQLFRIRIRESDKKWKIDKKLYRWVGIADTASKISIYDYPLVHKTENLDSDQIILDYKPQRYIFLMKGDILSGPYDFSDSSDLGNGKFNVRLSSLKHRIENDLNLDPFFIYRFNKNQISITKKEIIIKNYLQMYLVYNIKKVINSIGDKDLEKIDTISDKDLIDWANNQINENLISDINNINRIKSYIENISLNKDYLENRKRRVTIIFNKLEIYTTSLNKLVYDYIKENIDNKTINIPDTSFNDNSLKIENDSLYQEIEKLERDNELLSKELNQVKSIESRNSKEQNEILLLNNDIVDLNHRKKILEDDIAKLETDKNKLLDDNRILENSKENNVKLVRQTSTDFVNKLSEYKAYIDIITGHLAKRKDIKDNNFNTFNIYDQDFSLDEFFNEISLRLNKLNKKIDKNQLINYITNIFQNFITIFAGLPGSGKTSLVSILGKVIGIEQYNFSRLHKVYTQRGWTSIKDIIGFYNPISEMFITSPTGIYEFINEIKESNYSELLNLILLDEANLSSLEHYWSSFLLMADSPGGENNFIDLGDKDRNKLKVHRSIRFIGTINIDHTTEILSPRLIDRAPIILVHPSDEIALKPLLLADRQDLHSFNYEKLQNLLSYKSSTTFNNAEEEVLNEIDKILKRNQNYHFINFSPRKKEKIRNYVTVTRGIHEGHPLLALDYAISQHILTSINGNGDKYLKILESLFNAFTNLDLSRHILKNIIERGEDEHRFFRFF